ncbi:energy transducer TonB [Marinimicrobium sp. ABcell2]|uniref:energy transducer TonB n=1 Tax=Marinimicrobium sp. ABcell2 TaxID=3069751 RepID=UPI0027AEA40D|nr:energy transducer TonB [Marinimicrobium sp. ABcell2]MDQ2076535.1 energy transducer TonB [Marinimicrobium sp. ABcell2]
MNFARLSIGGALAVVVTFGLLFLMHSLINQDLGEDEPREHRRIADISMPQADIDTRYETPRPDRPDDVETPPPDIPEPEFDSPDIADGGLSLDAPTLDSGIELGGSGFSGDGEYMPIVAIAPEYPRRAAQRGIEGFVTVRFTVTTAGATRDIEVIDAVDTEGRPTTIFNRAAERAAERFRFRPRVIDGEPIEVPGVTYRFVFELAD